MLTVLQHSQQHVPSDFGMLAANEGMICLLIHLHVSQTRNAGTPCLKQQPQPVPQDWRADNPATADS
jgi:hypothetical protein